MKCKKTGCKANATSDGYCFAHSQRLEKKRKEAKRAGGSKGKLDTVTDTSLNTIVDIKGLLAEALNKPKAKIVQ